MDDLEVNLTLLEHNYSSDNKQYSHEESSLTKEDAARISKEDTQDHLTSSVQLSEKKNLELAWHDVSYAVKERSCNPFGKCEHPKLVHNLSGSIRNGQLTAIIGPSGAGKTTFIECLAGRRIGGVSGDIVVNCEGISKRAIHISYYSQLDSLNELLTVQESLKYACELSNFLPDISKRELLTNFELEDRFLPPPSKRESVKQLDKHLLETLYSELNLRKCANVQVSHCSGGQKRRLSIALELIFAPSIFLLDEPTSGLDSLSSLQCIAMLKKLVSNPERPMIIATSIHQPTAKIMSYFDQLYIISCNGQCIYNGPANELVETLSSLNFQCPQYHNPADFVIEIASGDFGLDCLAVMADRCKQVCHLQSSTTQQAVYSIKMSKLVERGKRQDMWNQFRTTGTLIQRTMRTTLRDPNMYLARLILILSSLALFFVLYKDEKVGKLDGCARRPTQSTMQELQSFKLMDSQNTYYGNFGFLFFSVTLVAFMSSMPTMLSFPLEVSVFIKENFNGWYSLKSYYLARQVADLPPILIFPLLFGTVSYFITEQYFEWHRFVMFQAVLVQLAFVAQGVGFLISAFYVNDVTAASIVGAMINIPLFMLTGLLIRIHSMPVFFRPITFLSYYRLAFESLLVIIYGLDRCEPVQLINFSYLKKEFGDQLVDMFVCVSDYSTSAGDNITHYIDNYNVHFLSNLNQSASSFALKVFNYDNDILYQNMVIMQIYGTAIRIVAFLVLYFKTRAK